MHSYNMSVEEILEKSDTTIHGLSLDEAKKRLKTYGENKFEEKKKKSKLSRFLEQFDDTMIKVLLIVAVFMGIYGFLYSNDYTDMIVIIVVVLLNAIMGFIQSEKAEVTLDGLKKYSTSNCKVRRAGEIKIIDSKKIVPGDIIILEAGDTVPADARIISMSNLKIDESALTGESISVEKQVEKINGNLEIQDQKNMILSGSSITSGKVEALVIRTGMHTELGSIATSLNTPYEVKTPLEIKIEEISKKITILIFFILIFTFIYGVVNKYEILEMIMLCTSLAVAAIPEGLPSVITISLSNGAGILARKKTIIRQMSSVETLGSTSVICSDKTGTITQNKMKVVDTDIIDERMFNFIAALNNETFIEKNKYVGDPTETCLFDYLDQEKIDLMKIISDNKRVSEIPFDSDRKMSSTINLIDGEYFLLVKGSLDNLLSRCNIDKNIMKKIRKKESEMSKKALRVIGFAYKKLDKLPSDKDLLSLEKNLEYVGIVGIIDPPRKDVSLSVEKCLKAGIRPFMITGDSLDTARAIAKEVGIIKNDDEAILGSELDKYSDTELIEIVKKYGVYARVNPDHKRRIVAAWQKNGEVVAMTGDGVNDAPAIKDAHVGIGMGITGTEVTKSVADVILLDDSFSTIVVAVEEGRRIFTNIRNNIVYSLSSNFAEMFAILIGMFTGNTILLPIHILFIDMVTDSIPSICLSFEKSEDKIMENRPRSIDKPVFTPFLYACLLSSAIIETIFIIITFFVAKHFYNDQIATTLTLLAVVVQEIFYAISCRNLKDFIINQGFFANKQLNLGIIILIIIELLVFLTPVGKLINIVRVDTQLILITLFFNTAGFFAYEGIKPILVKLFKD